MAIFPQVRQKTGASKVLPAFSLCLVSWLLLGFSMPVIEQDLAVPSVVDPIPTPVESVSLEGLESFFGVNAPISHSLARRPVSFSHESLLEPVLGLIKPSHFSGNDPALFSDNRFRFQGVGFPHIRHQSGVREFDVEQPSNWVPMVAWRANDADKQLQEPIARVRCMGLSPQAVARRADRYDSLILETALEHDVSVSLIKAIVTEESCFNKQALSPVGAQGLMQLMPDTARWLKVKDPLDPEQNIRAGVRYIASLREQFGTLELALAAYNAGPGNVRRYNGVPPFAETQAYVRKVKAFYRRYIAATRLSSSTP